MMIRQARAADPGAFTNCLRKAAPDEGGSYERQLRQSVCLSLQPKGSLWSKDMRCRAGPIDQGSLVEPLVQLWYTIRNINLYLPFWRRMSGDGWVAGFAWGRGELPLYC